MTILISPTFSNNNLSFRTLTLLLFDALALSISNQNVSSNFSEVTFFPSFTVLNKRYKRIWFNDRSEIISNIYSFFIKILEILPKLYSRNRSFYSTVGDLLHSRKMKRYFLQEEFPFVFFLQQKKTTKDKQIRNKRHITKINWLLFFSANPLFWITPIPLMEDMNKE